MEQLAIVLSLAWRNMLRNPRRTLITSMAIIAGTAALVVGQGFVDGLDENVIRAEEDTISGHVLLIPEGYPDDGLSYPLDKARKVTDALARRLADRRVAAWAARLVFQARLVEGEDSVRVKVFGYDPTRDPQVFPRAVWKVKGDWPGTNPARPQVALGAGLAELVDAHLGSPLVIEVRTLHGAMNALTFTVSGLVRTRNPAVDSLGVWMPLSVADELVQSGGVRSAVAVRLEGGRGSADAARSWLRGDGWTAYTATEEVRDLLEINRFRRKALGLVVFILLAIAGTGIANTILMASYERIREVGTLRAMGLSRGGVRALFLVEGAFMGLLGGAIGTTIGAVTVIHYEHAGIDLTQLADNLGDVPISTVLYLRFSWGVVAAGIAFAVGVAALAGIHPASHAAAMRPADAVRAD